MLTFNFEVSVIVCGPDAARESWTRIILDTGCEITSGATVTQARGFWGPTGEFEDNTIVHFWTDDPAAVLAHITPTVQAFQRDLDQQAVSITVRRLDAFVVFDAADYSAVNAAVVNA